MFSPPDIERFWAKVDKAGPVPERWPHLGPCWLWTAGKSDGGYGVFSVGGTTISAHRYAWMLVHGEMGERVDACHKCDNPPCVRPDHIFPGTREDNARDAIAKRGDASRPAFVRPIRRPPVESFVSEGHRLFVGLIRGSQLTLAGVGAALQVSHACVQKWETGMCAPDAFFRAAIERWTNGAVPASSWLTPEEQRRLAAIAPFVPARSAA